MIDRQNYNGYIFDVDGTLYAQGKTRFIMFVRLLAYFCIRPFRWRELFALYLFRKLRERPEFKKLSVPQTCILMQKRLKLSASAIENTIRLWMFEKPLDLLCKYCHREVVDFIKSEHAAGKKIIIYSDYPALNKLHAMSIPYDHLFTSGEHGLQEQKPSETAMRTILKITGFSSAELLYVGDRDDRDKASAELVHMNYCDIRNLRKQLGGASK